MLLSPLVKMITMRLYIQGLGKPHCQIKECVYTGDEDRPSHLRKINLIAFNILSFPIREPLNYKLNVFQIKDFILYRSIQNGVLEVRGFIKVFMVRILVI